jgi:hypothetical protein
VQVTNVSYYSNYTFDVTLEIGTLGYQVSIFYHIQGASHLIMALDATGFCALEDISNQVRQAITAHNAKNTPAQHAGGDRK